ncbi:MAG: DUF1292 domain-containing protein [Streptococcaceae bacterium]|nr:DUF1292 domain-containing protein [Streptococcaceae bacterium]
MSEHPHNHDEEEQFITLIDEEGNETLFEVLITFQGEGDFADKNYVLVTPAGREEDENGEIEIQAYSYTENESGTEGQLEPIPEDAEAEWDFISEVFEAFIENQDDEVY